MIHQLPEELRPLVHAATQRLIIPQSGSHPETHYSLPEELRPLVHAATQRLIIPQSVAGSPAGAEAARGA